ncbi:MAG: TA0938 family protein [Candidatus Thorarchaeota archaeon]
MIPRTDGCVLCGSTWGNFWLEIEGIKRFFCCRICAQSFKNLLRSITESTGWPRVTKLQISGNVYRRNVLAGFNEEFAVFAVTFTSSGEISSFSKTKNH